MRQFTILLALALLFVACGRDATPPAAPVEAVPTPAPVKSEIEPADPPAPLSLLGENLIGASGTTSSCDAPETATIACNGATVTVDVPASSYARWSLRWDEVERGLDGTETLRLRARADEGLTPNLYFVQANGERVAVNLTRNGLRRGEVRVPLAEVVDEAGQRPDFAQINELQIVFEYADMAGALTLDELRFDEVWREEVAVDEAARTLAAGLTVPPGFVAEPVVGNLREMTQIAFTPSGEMLVSLQNGRVWWYRDIDENGSFDERHLYAAGLTEVVGLLPESDAANNAANNEVGSETVAVWLGGRGQLFRTTDADGNGVADRYELRVDGLPWGRHQNNGLAWNPVPDPFTGEGAQQWIYFGLGSTEDLEVGGPLNATVLRFPSDGQSAEALEVVSRGNRNPYAVAWGNVPVDLSQPDGERAWQLFASENGPDFNDAPDEVNHIRWGHDYGFPEQFGQAAEGADGEPYSGPIYAVTPHASASGLAYVDNPAWPAEYRTLYVSLFGQIFDEAIVGHAVERVSLSAAEAAAGPTYRGQPSTFISGLDRPLPLAVDPAGNLLVGDYATGVIFRVRYAGD